MRDRLEELQQRAQEFSEAAEDNTNPLSEAEDDESVVGVIKPQAVVFEVEPIIENFLSEAQKIRDDITALEMEVITLLLLFDQVITRYYVSYFIEELVVSTKKHLLYIC